MAGASFALDSTRLQDVLLQVEDEVERAHAKHGDESMVSPTVDLGKRLGILGEEFGEVCRATTYDNADRANLREELVQTAAMAVSWAYALDTEDAAAKQREE